MLAGSAAVIRETGNFGLFFLVVDPEMLLPGGQCKARMSELRRSIAANRPWPGRRRCASRATAASSGAGRRWRRERVSIDERVYKRIQELCG